MEEKPKIVPEDSQIFYDSGVEADGAFIGSEIGDGRHAILPNTYEILNSTELGLEDYPIRDDFPVNGAKHRAAVKGIYNALENGIEATAYVLSATDGAIREVSTDFEGYEPKIEVHDLDEELQNGIKGILDDIRRSNVEFKNAEEAKENYENSLQMEWNAAHNDKELAQTQEIYEQNGVPDEILETYEKYDSEEELIKSIIEERKKAEENVELVRENRNSFNQLPYSEDNSEDGFGMLYLELEDPQAINKFGDVMKENALKISENDFKPSQRVASD